MPGHSNSSTLEELPHPSTRRIALRVTREAERALRQGHPWVYESAIQHQSRPGQPGDLAVIFDHNREFLAIGLYDPHSPIRVRILQHSKTAPIGCAFYAGRMAEAIKIRASFLDLPPEQATTGYRLVHGENDGLPGLVIDRYVTTLVIKLYTAAWVPHLADLLAGLEQVAPAERLVLRLSRALQELPEALYGLADGMLLNGPPLVSPLLFSENGLRFEADLLHGHKTGFYFDQRDNRLRVEQLAGGKSVLNVFAYSGGFSVYAARGGATPVTSLDASQPALAAAERNFAHNRHLPAVAGAHHEVIIGEAFEQMAELAAVGCRYEMVIIDPPAFAQNQTQVDQALAAYQRLTRLGLGLLHPGGILVQASCTSRVTAAAFYAAIHRVASEIGRPLQELARTGHPSDHPITYKEGAYLKCLFAIS
jgi:23S rRNA (cytosine1962-C5)-methyltransferase